MTAPLVGEMRGCAFRERCSYATAVCAEPVEVRSEAGHEWRCVLTRIPAEAA
jgi:peptide/nickel transport system ATP-binding protein